MASLQGRNGSCAVLFCYHGKLHTLTIAKVEGRSRGQGKEAQVPARLCGSAPAGGDLAGVHTNQLLGHAIDAQPLPSVTVEGASGTLSRYE